MRINNNIMALNAHRQLGVNQSNASKSMERLSSGMRINRAGDDAAGLAISEKMRGQIRGLKQAARNAQDGISLIQTAEGGLNESHAILQRMRELANQAANDTNVGVDRGEIQKEITALTSELNRIGNTTEFNTQKLLNGGDVAGAGPGGPTGAIGNFTVGTSSDDTTPTAGVYSFEITTNLADGDVVTIAGKDYTAGEDFEVGDDIEATAAALAAVITGGYTATAAAGVITLTEETPSGVDLNAGDITIARSGGGGGGTGVGYSAALQIGANNAQSMTIEIGDMRAAALYVSGDTASGTVTAKDGAVASYVATQEVTNGTTNTGAEYALDVSSHEKATAALSVIDDAIEAVSSERSKLGAYQNRLEHTIANLGTSAENLQAAESRIRDLDMAEEIMAFTKNNILQQAATAMLAQANMAPQSVLQLLG